MPFTGGCKNSFHPQKAPESAFDKYSINAGKSNQQFSVFCLTPINAQKRLSVPSFAEIGTRVALRLIFATWCVIKGVVWKLRCLLYPAIAVEQTAEE